MFSKRCYCLIGCNRSWRVPANTSVGLSGLVTHYHRLAYALCAASRSQVKLGSLSSLWRMPCSSSSPVAACHVLLLACAVTIALPGANAEPGVSDGQAPPRLQRLAFEQRRRGVEGISRWRRSLRPPPSKQIGRDFVYLAPPQLGLGDQLNGLTTAVWLARVLQRPLKVCNDLNGVISLPRARSAQCAQWTEQFRQESFKQHFSLTRDDTIFVGCYKSKNCSQITTSFPGSDPSKTRRVTRITHDLWDAFWSNADFLRLMNASHRVVLSINRNAVSFLKKTMNREILHSVLRIQPPLYENCLHYRSYRMRNKLESYVQCTGVDPVVIFSDLNSRHLHINDGKQPRSRHGTKGINHTFADSIQGFLNLARCKHLWIGTSSFGAAAAFASAAEYKDIWVFPAGWEKKRDCREQKPFLHALTQLWGGTS